MRKIYEHIEFARVGLFQSILESAGIDTHVKNLGASSCSGELIATEVYPELWVVNDEDYPSALEILKPYYKCELPVAADWVCDHCQESVPGSMEECWKCQTPKAQA